jgi:P-type Ca2+ transporter type 2C
MTVVEAVIMDSRLNCKLSSQFLETIDTKSQQLSFEALKFIVNSLEANSTVETIVKVGGEKYMQGSKTEIALLNFTKTLMLPFQDARDSINVLNIIPFSSECKRMGCIVSMKISQDLKNAFGNDSDNHFFVKGASELVLESCSSIMVADGSVKPMTFESKERYLIMLDSFASDALRTIACAFKPGDREEYTDMILMGIFGIIDPIRPEVPKAVSDCQKAGISVRMVTGDSIDTAKAISRRCGILTANGLIMEGREFRALNDAKRLEILPRLQVLARSSPLDKQLMVLGLKSLGETVAVTGGYNCFNIDGTNDAPALSSADVGFAMGSSGTEVAKEACDIILMDDNFASIVRAVVWGRSVYDAIRKFIQFQVTVSVSAVVIAIVTLISSILSGVNNAQPILSALHLLWINLIMNTLAAIAFATDKPSESLLQRKPAKRAEKIVSTSMMYQILGQSSYQIMVCLILYFVGPVLWWPPVEQTNDEPPSGYVTATVIFNTFVFCQIFNELNCRSISQGKRDFNYLDLKGIVKNAKFLFFLFISALGQVLMVQYGSIVTLLDSGGLSAVNWVISVMLGIGSLAIGFLIRMIPIEEGTGREVTHVVAVSPPRYFF